MCETSKALLNYKFPEDNRKLVDYDVNGGIG